jgi:hypothetical protein
MEEMYLEWGVKSQSGGNGEAIYGPYSTKEHAEEVRDLLIEGGGKLIKRYVTAWEDED